MAIISDKTSMGMFGLHQLRSGLSLELKGLRVGRGSTCYATIKRMYGMRGNREKVLKLFTAYVKERNIDYWIGVYGCKVIEGEAGYQVDYAKGGQPGDVSPPFETEEEATKLMREIVKAACVEKDGRSK